MHRYHYDAARGECGGFAFLGCGGNRNNFATRDKCRRTCAEGKGGRRER